MRSWLYERAFECRVCGWQGMHRPSEVNICPECGCDMTPRSWLDTWGLTLLILGFVVGAVLFVAFFGRA